MQQRRAQEETHVRAREVAKKVHVADLYERRLRFLRRLTAIEDAQALAAEQAAAKTLKKAQLVELRRQPKEQRRREDEVRRSFSATVKSQQKQVKEIQKMLSRARKRDGTPDPVLVERAGAQDERLAELSAQYRYSLEAASSFAEEELARRHRAAWAVHTQTHSRAREALTAYQSSRAEYAQNARREEQEALAEEAAVAAAARAETAAEAAAALKRERERLVVLRAKHAEELEGIAAERRRCEAAFRLTGAGGGGGRRGETA